MISRVQLSLALTLLTLGILLSVQFRTTQEALKSLTAQTPQDLAMALKQQSEKKYNLQQTQWDLQVNLKALDSASTQRKDVVSALQNELTNLNGASGLNALTGPGISITIPGTTPIVTDELISIVNELWNVGAEGVAVNNIRITAFSALYDGTAKNELLTFVGKQPLRFPYIITAIGDPDKLQTGINIAGGTVDLLRMNKTYIDVERHDKLVLPVAVQPSQFKYAKVSSQQVPAVQPGEAPAAPPAFP